MRLDIVLISTADFPAMLAFYRDVLGLSSIDEDPDPELHEPGVDWAAFDAGGMRLELFGTPDAEPMEHEHVAVVPAFRVEGLDAVIESPPGPWRRLHRARPRGLGRLCQPPRS